MITKIFPIAVVLVSMVAGCTRGPQVDAFDADKPTAKVEMPPTEPNPAPNENAPAVANINSDNNPVLVRSGLNSDANNPSGAPGHPVIN
jgi:hypothetical protein